jgi:hypothetical protein
MTRTQNECVIDFPVAFSYLVTLACTATTIWIDAVPSPPGIWPLAILWICVVGAWLSFRFDKSWAATGALAFCISTLIIAGGGRIAFLL